MKDKGDARKRERLEPLYLQETPGVINGSFFQGGNVWVVAKRTKPTGGKTRKKDEGDGMGRLS